MGDDAREALWTPEVTNAGKPKTPPRWWSEESIVAWLCGSSVRAASKDAPVTDSFKLERRLQAHVGIQAETLTADDGVLFAHDVVETLESTAEWAIAAEIKQPAGSPPSLATLGADGRLVHVEPLDSSLFEPPPNLLHAFEANRHRGIRLVVTTPAEFPSGWLPFDLAPRNGNFEGTMPELGIPVVLRAAFVGRPVHISGWDMAKNEPKSTSRMVPPGSVYFLERTDGLAFDETDARALWHGASGMRTGEGFGRVVPGIWNPDRS